MTRRIRNRDSIVFFLPHLSTSIWVQGITTNLPNISALLLSSLPFHSLISFLWLAHLPLNPKDACTRLLLTWIGYDSTMKLFRCLLWRTHHISTAKIVSRNEREHWSHMFVGNADRNRNSSVKPSLNFPSNPCVSARNSTRIFHMEVIMDKQELHTFDVPNWSTLASRIHSHQIL